jgi:hypothetical protein
MIKFIQFLFEILYFDHQISFLGPERLENLSKALNDAVDNDPKFPLQFYVSMVGIINLLNDSSKLNLQFLKEKVLQAIDLAKNLNFDITESILFKNSASKISLKTLNVINNQNFQKLLTKNEEILVICRVFIVLFRNIDDSIQINYYNSLCNDDIIRIIKSYTDFPDKMIETCKKVEDFIIENRIPESSIKLAQEILAAINENKLLELDNSGEIVTIYEFLKLWIIYYWGYNHNQSSPSRNSNLHEESSLDATQPSYVKLKNPRVRRLNAELLENKVPSPDVQIPWTKSVEDIKEIYFSALEDQFKQFLKSKPTKPYPVIISRIQVLDEFEATITSLIRTKFLNAIAEKNPLDI